MEGYWRGVDEPCGGDLMRAGDAKIASWGERLEAMRSLVAKPGDKPEPRCKCGRKPIILAAREWFCALCFIHRGLAREYQEVVRAFVPPGDPAMVSRQTQTASDTLADQLGGRGSRGRVASGSSPRLPIEALPQGLTQHDIDAQFPPQAQAASQRLPAGYLGATGKQS